MSWDFVWGVLIGSSLGLLFAGLMVAGRDNQDYIELNERDEKTNEDKNKEVEE